MLKVIQFSLSLVQQLDKTEAGTFLAFLVLTSVAEAAGVSDGAVAGGPAVVGHALTAVTARVVCHTHVHFHLTVLAWRSMGESLGHLSMVSKK